MIKIGLVIALFFGFMFGASYLFHALDKSNAVVTSIFLGAIIISAIYATIKDGPWLH